MTKRTNVIFSLVFSMVFTCCAIADTNIPTPSPSTEHLDAVAAVVNNQIITQSELNRAIVSAKQQIAGNPNSNAISDTQLRKMVLDQLIDEKLQLELAKRANITVSEADVTKAIQHIADGNGLSIVQLKEKLQQEGMNYMAYRKLIHKQLIIHQVEQNAVGSSLNLTEEDKQAALTEYQSEMNAQQQFHIIDILADTKNDAEKIIAQLRKGADIDSVAPNQTSDLGWRSAGALPSLFLQQLTNMKPGDIAGPIQAPNGFHVIKLVAMHGETNQPTQQQLQNMAYQMKFQKAVATWVKKLRETAYIKIND